LNPAQVVEAVLFASDAPLKAEEIARADESLDEDLIEDAIGELNAAYSESERAFEIRELGEGFQLLTKPEFAPYLERFDTVPRPSRVSGPALETLAIIAYRQPIGRIEIEYIRGVSSAGVIRTLTDRALVDVASRGEGLGRPLLYGTTQRFLEHFGFRSLDDLPRPEELPVILRERALLEEGTEEEAAEPDESPAEVAELGVEDVLAGEASDALESGEDVEAVETDSDETNPESGAVENGAVQDEPIAEDVKDPDSD
jgi:segregation and condensation protein B